MPNDQCPVGLEAGLSGRARDGDGVVARIGGVEDDGDFFLGGGGDHEAGVVGGDGQGAASAVDEDGEFDLGGAAVVEELVEGGLHGAAGLEDVVDQDDRCAGDVDRDDGGRELLGDRIAADVVAMEGYVDDAGARAAFFRVMLAQEQLEARDDVDAAIGDAEHDKTAGWIGRVTRGDLGGESIQGETDLGLGNEGGGLGLGGHGGLRFAHRDGAGKARSGARLAIRGRERRPQLGGL